MTARAKSAFTEAVEMIRSRLSRDRMGGKVARGTLQTIMVSGIGAAISMVVQMGLSQALGQASFGTYAVVMGWLAIATIFGKLELDVTAVRFIGKYAATEEWGVLRGYLRAGRADRGAVLAEARGTGGCAVGGGDLRPADLDPNHIPALRGVARPGDHLAAG